MGFLCIINQLITSKKYYKNANNCFSRKERNILHFLWVIKINEKIILFLSDNINEAKLGNFPEIDAFVIISCYNNSIIDEKQFYKLVITPFDLVCAMDN